MKAFLIHVPPPTPDPEWKRYLGPCCAMIRSALRDMLTLNFTHKDETFLFDTDIPRGVPPIVRQRTTRMHGLVDRAYEFQVPKVV